MRYLILVVFSSMVFILSGCGGGGGGGGSGPTTKTATLVLSYQKNVVSDQIGGFDIAITLPAGASIKVDAGGIPLASSVFLSGEFAGLSLNSAGVTYSNATATQKLLSITAANFTNQTAQQGVFLTVVCDVPVSYTPNANDVLIAPPTFTDQSNGADIPVTVSAAFN